MNQFQIASFAGALLPAMVCLVSTQGFSQEVTDQEEITVVAPYQPTIVEAFKVNINPRIPDETLVKPEFKYGILSQQIQTSQQLEPIVPARIEGESVSKLHKNYIRAGIGNYVTPYFEFFANKLRSKKSAFGAHVVHLSSSGKIKDYAYPGNGRTDLDFYGKKFFPKHTFSADVYAGRKWVHYYGYKPDDFLEIDLDRKDIKQHYTRTGVKTVIESNYTRDRLLNHKIGLDYRFLITKDESTENNLNFYTYVNRTMEFFSFSEVEKLGIDLGVDYYFNNDKLTGANNNGIIRIDPYYTLQFDQYKFKLGFNTAVESDTSSSVHVYPVAHVEVKVVEDYLITYAGITGRLEKNSLQSLSDENPFILSFSEKKFTNYNSEQYGGIKGRITRFLDYNLAFTNATVTDMPLFINDTVSMLGEGLNNQFTVIYDRVKHTRLLAEFGFHYRSKFNAMLRTQYHSYFLDDEDKAWHKPAFELSLTADYIMQDKIIIKMGLFTQSRTYAKLFGKDSEGNTGVIAQEIKGMTDLNLGVEYRYSSTLSGFLNLNNLLGQRYYQWYNYPSYRFNLMLGVAYSF